MPKRSCRILANKKVEQISRQKSVERIDGSAFELLTGWWFQPCLNNMLVKLDHFPKDRDENQKYLKPPS